MPPAPPAARDRGSAWAASLAYLVLALLLTWPLAARLSHALPSDLVDPALNAWVLAWGSEHLLRLLQGELGAFRGFWDANIFHPAPLTLAYSEHLVAPMLQIAPVYALTRDPVLCHNLLLLASFVLAGLGAFLLARDLIGPVVPAFVAGLLYAFALYRFDQLPHLQVLSAQWMPFALLGLRRFVLDGRLRPLVWGSLALVAQNLSCGYHVLYFPPFLALALLFEMWRHGRLRSRRTWAGLLAASLFVLATTVPLLLPYAALRRLEATRRAQTEVERFSAEVYSFVTAPQPLRLWGERLALAPRAEGALFAGVVPLLLAGVALGAEARRSWRSSADLPWSSHGRVGAMLAGGALLGGLGLLAAALVRLLGVPRLAKGPLELGLPGLGVLLARVLLAFGGLALLSPRFRGWLRASSGSVVVACGMGLVLVAWLACGPSVRAAGRDLGLASLYLPLYEYVPGFDGLRAPSRFMMVGTLFLSLLGGFGALELERGVRRGRALVALAGLLFLGEAWAVPIRVNESWGGEGVRPPVLGCAAGERSPLYAHVATLPSTAVLAELPIGLECWETQYMLCSTRHWRRLVNGYSGYFPASYPSGVLGRADRDPRLALQRARSLGVTHLIVHEGAWYGARGGRVRRRLERAGAQPLARFGSDVLLELPH